MMLRGGCDTAPGGAARRGGLGVEGDAKVLADGLQQPDVLGGVGDATPACRGPVQHRPQQAECGTLPGQPADDLDPTTRLTEGTFD